MDSLLRLISGHLRKVDGQTTFFCNEFPLGGNGPNGVDALSTFFPSLVAYAAHSHVRDSLKSSPKLTGRVDFSFDIPEIDYVLAGYVTTNGYKSFTARFKNQAARPGRRTRRDPFAAITAILELARTTKPRIEERRFEKGTIGRHLEAGKSANFSMTGQDLGSFIHYAVERLDGSLVSI